MPIRELWILGLDEDGCLMPDSCEEINIITSLHNVESQDDIVAYPNPVQDKLYFSKDEEYHFSIWNANMTLVKTGTVRESISFGDLPAALYIVRIDAKGSTPRFMKIIKI